MLSTELKKACDRLIEAKRLKEEFEVEYTLKEAQKIHSAEVQAYANQTLRDAKVKVLLEEDYRKLVGLRTEYSIAYYLWETLKTIAGGSQ